MWLRHTAPQLHYNYTTIHGITVLLESNYRQRQCSDHPSLFFLMVFGNVKLNVQGR